MAFIGIHVIKRIACMNTVHTYKYNWSLQTFRQLVPKNFLKKMENYSTLEMVLLMCNWNCELLVAATFDSKVSSLRTMRKKNLYNSEKFAIFLFYLFCRLLTFELSNINWKCSENCNMLTERTYDSVLNIITICIFIA